MPASAPPTLAQPGPPLDSPATPAGDDRRAIHLFVVIFFLVTVSSGLVIQTAAELSRGQRLGALAVFQQKPTAANLRAYEDNLEAASLVATALRPLFQFVQFAWLRDGGDKALLGRAGWLFYKPGYAEMLASPEKPSTNDAVAAIIACRNALAERGIHLLVVPVPNKESVYPDYLTRRAVAGRGLIAPATRDLLSRLHSAGVDYVDLFELFLQARQHPAGSPGSSLYLAQDSHWSPAGAELAAKTVGELLLQKGWVEPQAAEYRTTPVSVARLGDIFRMLQAPRIERCATPEKILCAQVVRGDRAQPYRDDPESQVLILGDSFLRIYHEDEPGSAGFIAHLAKELQQPLTTIINDGGASTLVRQELYRRPALLKKKRVVVWEFVERDIRLGTEGWQHVPLPEGQ